MFICMKSKQIHLKLLRKRSASDLLDAVKRFRLYYTHCNRIYISDNNIMQSEVCLANFNLENVESEVGTTAPNDGIIKVRSVAIEWLLSDPTIKVFKINLENYIKSTNPSTEQLIELFNMKNGSDISDLIGDISMTVRKRKK